MVADIGTKHVPWPTLQKLLSKLDVRLIGATGLSLLPGASAEALEDQQLEPGMMKTTSAVARIFASAKATAAFAARESDTIVVVVGMLSVANVDLGPFSQIKILRAFRILRSPDKGDDPLQHPRQDDDGVRGRRAGDSRHRPG